MSFQNERSFQNVTFYALTDWNAMFDAINYQVVCKSNGKHNFSLHVLCHPGLHFRSFEPEVRRWMDGY
jgi:hypothetical protein